MIDRMLAAIAALVTRRPRQVVAALVLLTAGAGFGLTRFEIDSDYASFLPEGVRPPSGDSRALFVITRGQDMADVARRLRASPYLAEVRATREELLAERIAAVREAPLYHLPPEALDRLATHLTTERKAALEELLLALEEDPVAGRELALRDPLQVRWIFREAGGGALPDVLDPHSPYLVTRDGVGFLLVRGTADPFDLDYSLALLADLEGRIDAEFFGGYVVARTDAARMRRDMMWASFSSIALVLLFLWRSTKNLLAAHLMLLPTVCAIVWTLGYGALALGPLNPLVVSAAAVLTGLGVDFAIHYAGRLAEERGDVRRATVRTGRLLLWGMLTGAVAFLSLLLGHFPGLRTFGLLLACGLCFAFLATLLMLPMLLERIPISAAPGPVVRYFSGMRGRKPAAIALVLVAASAWVLVATQGIGVDADPRRFRPDDDPLMAMQRRFERELGFSPEPLRVRTNAALDDQRAAVSALLRPAAALSPDGIVPDSLVRGSDGPHKTTPHEHVERFRERTKGWVSAALRDLAAIGLNPDPFRSPLEDLDRRFRNDADLSGPMLLFVAHALWDKDERAKAHAQILAQLPEGTSIEDPYGLSDAITPHLRADLWQAFRIAGGAVVLIVVLSTRSIAALVPVFIGFGITFWAMRLFGLVIHPGNFVAFPFLLGLGVDDGIHMVGRAKEDRGDPLLTTGQAVWRTSATTFLGFGSLAFASTPAFASMGVILAIGIAACFLASVVVLPALSR